MGTNVSGPILISSFAAPTNATDALTYMQAVPANLDPGTGGGTEADLVAGGGGAWTQNLDYASGATGANANATVGGYYIPGFIRPTGDSTAQNLINWDKFFIADFILMWEQSTANSVAYLKVSQDTTHAALGSKGMAISAANLTVAGHHYDTQIRTTSAIYTATAGQPFHVTFIHIPSVGEYIYIDGVQKYAVTTNLLSGNSGGTATYLISRATGATAANTTVLVARPQFWFPKWL